MSRHANRRGNWERKSEGVVGVDRPPGNPRSAAGVEPANEWVFLGRKETLRCLREMVWSCGFSGTIG
jgi:hypothetical protein